jgi:hypothetical protein
MTTILKRIEELRLDEMLFQIAGNREIIKLVKGLNAELNRMVTERENLERNEFEGLTRNEVIEINGIDPVTNLSLDQKIVHDIVCFDEAIRIN